MIRKAILKDVNSIEDTYNEHFQYELNHTAFTVFKKGVYPTKDDAERAIYAGALFVYEENGTIVGEVALHETDIVTENGNITQLVLAQSAVSPEYRMQGIMRRLVEYALEEAEKMGYGAVFLGGNPNLYGRFGFEPSSSYGIYHENRKKWGDEGFMVCILKAGVLDGVTGTTYYYGG